MGKNTKAAEAKAAEAKAAEAKAAEAKAAEAKAAEAKAAGVVIVVAEGRAITSKRGLLQAGDEVKVAYLGGGDKAFKKLLKDGHIVKK